jgi:hypothetical protein
MNWVQLQLDLRQRAYEDAEILDYVKAWLNTNIDEGSPESIEEDSLNLYNKIKEMEEEYYG